MKKVLAIAISSLILTGCAPLSLDSSTANDILFSKRDFSIDVTQAEKELSISEVDGPIFNSSDDCGPDDDLASLIEDEGRVLASSDLISVGSSDVYIHQDVLEFETPEIAGEFLDLVREGLEGTDCEYNSDTDFSVVKTKYYDISNTNDFYSVSSNDSVVWLADFLFKTKSSTLKLDLSSDSLHTVVRQNNYVLVLKGTIYRDSDVRASIRDLEEDFAIIVKQFVSGKKVSN